MYSSYAGLYAWSRGLEWNSYVVYNRPGLLFIIGCMRDFITYIGHTCYLIKINLLDARGHLLVFDHWYRAAPRTGFFWGSFSVDDIHTVSPPPSKLI